MRRPVLMLLLALLLGVVGTLCGFVCGIDWERGRR